MTTDEQTIRGWFTEHGWQLEPADLRSALEERGATVDLIVELIDEGADRRRAQPQPQQEPSRNGHSRPASLPSVPNTTLVPPQNLEAEESVLGAAMLSNGASIPRCAEIVQPDHFYRESHARIWSAAIDLHARGIPVDPITLTGELEQRGHLDGIGGRVRLHELAALVPAASNAPHYAKIVADTALLRNVIRVGGEIARSGWEGGDPSHILDRTLTELRRIEVQADVGTPPEASGGGAFIFDEPVDIDTIRIWGKDAGIGWASGEALMIGGPDGVGKTTLMQQLCLARAGLRDQVLGMHVQPDPTGVLYIAADRPRQAARSIHRMVVESERDHLDQTMTFWRGPLPQLLNEDRTILTRLAKQFGRGTIAIDSLKDVAVDIATDEAGGRIASALQHAIASGIEIIVAHHPRKPGVESSRKPRELADFYGSRLIFGVVGSAIMLWGEPGDVLIELSHLKQPIEELGPWNLLHDHRNGHTTVEKGLDLLDLLLNAGTSGLTAKAAASLMYQKDEPSRAEVHRVRQRLERLADNDKAVKLPSIALGGETRYLYNGPAEVLTR